MDLKISNKFYYINSPKIIKFNKIFQNDDALLYARNRANVLATYT